MKRMSLQTKISKFESLIDSDDEYEEETDVFVVEDLHLDLSTKTKADARLFEMIQYAPLSELKQAINKEIDKSIDLLVDAGHNNATIMHLAARYNRADVINMLLGEYNAQIDVLDSLESTPLFFAAAHGHAKVLFYLQKKFTV
jgi:ankyrin repeat protein